MKDKHATFQLLDRADGPAVIAYQKGLESAVEETEWHSHLRGQFFYLEQGVIVLRTRYGAWTMPPHRGGWMPPGIEHTVRIVGPISGWGALIAPAATEGLPEQPCIIGASELLHALVHRAIEWTDNDMPDPRQQRVLDMLLDEIQHAPVQPLHLPMPLDRRLQRIADALIEQPRDERTLENWAAWAGLSSRTLSRLFRQETGCSFAQWRQQARLTHALERLVEGEAVASVADALGYAGPSAFIAMFRRSFGHSPTRYLSNTRGQVLA